MSASGTIIGRAPLNAVLTTLILERESDALTSDLCYGMTMRDEAGRECELLQFAEPPIEIEEFVDELFGVVAPFPKLNLHDQLGDR